MNGEISLKYGKKIKVLFVSSGNSEDFEVSPFIRSQGESLRKAGIDVQFLPLVGKGLTGYLKNALNVRQYVKSHKIDLIHAHYTLSGWSAVLARTGKPLILSLMGDDANGSYITPKKINFKSRFLRLSTRLIQPFLDAIISKSPNISRIVYRNKIEHIIPNGVDLQRFVASNISFRDELGWDRNKKYILFLGKKEVKVKNYPLLLKAVSMIGSSDIELVNPYPLSHKLIFKYLSSADTLVLTSFMEGSPNVVKEAMACNCPIVSTDVGDVRWVMGDTQGCYVTSFDPQDVADKITQALEFSRQHGRTNGRQRIIELGLDSESVARRIIEVYKKVLN